MAAKQCCLMKDARKALLRGVEKLSRAVKVTLGPKGPQCGPRQEIWFADHHQGRRDGGEGNRTGRSVREHGRQWCAKSRARPATSPAMAPTTATVLAESIYREGLRNVTAGANSDALQRGINKAVTAVVEHLNKISKKVKDRSEIMQVATIPANGDKTIGNIIADAMDKVGQRWHDHGRGSQVDRDHARCR